MLTFKNLDFNLDLDGFVATLSNDKIVQIQFDKEQNRLSADFGQYYAHIDMINEYGLDLTDEEYELVKLLIKNNEEISAKLEELNA